MDITEKAANMSLNDVTQIRKRQDYLTWQDYFMATAFLAAQRSKDPNYQVGACIVNKDNKIVGIGYNGMPNGCSDDEFPWARKDQVDSPLDSKCFYVCHAEVNAIVNKNSSDVKDCHIYVNLFPCNECAKVIIQSGISKIYYVSDEKAHKNKYKASKRMLDAAGVKYKQYIPTRSRIEITFGVNWDEASPSNA